MQLCSGLHQHTRWIHARGTPTFLVSVSSSCSHSCEPRDGGPGYLLCSFLAPPLDASLLLGICFYPREPMSWVGLRNPDGGGVAPSTTYVSGWQVPLASQPRHITCCFSMARCSLCRWHDFVPEPMSLYCDSSTGVRREIYMESFPFTGTSNTTRSAKCQAEGMPSLRARPFPALSPNQAGSLFMSPNIWIRAVFSSVGYAAYGV